MAKKRILVLCVDRDNDLYEKVKVSGPIMGKEANIEAATKLALKDPEETDANTIFEAVRVYDSISKENNAEVVTLTGDKSLGYFADREIAKQLDSVLRNFRADSCILVSDGASDEQVIPIIQSRMKIDSVKLVVMKQAKELEKTYFVLLEKLKEPHYARIVWGIPALLILLLILSEILGYGWKLVGAAIGLYFLIKGFGVEESIIRSFSEFRFSVEKLSLIFYLSALPLLVISLVLGYQEFLTRAPETPETLKLAAYILLRMLLLLPWAATLLVLGRILDLLHERKKYAVVRYGLYAVSVFILWAVFTVASQWILADVYFSDFVATLLASMMVAFISLKIMEWIKIDLLTSMRLENKEVLTELGAYIGKIVGVDKRKGLIVVQTPFGHRMDFDFDRISDVGERVVIK
jgi:putative membrane protein